MYIIRDTRDDRYLKTYSNKRSRWGQDISVDWTKSRADAKPYHTQQAAHKHIGDDSDFLAGHIKIEQA